MNQMSPDERSVLAASLDVRDLGLMARAARVWADAPRRRQLELRAQLRDQRARWAMVSSISGALLARTSPLVGALPYLGEYLWLPQYGAHMPIAKARLLCVGEGRCWSGEWLGDAELESKSAKVPLTWSDVDYPGAARGMPKRSC